MSIFSFRFIGLILSIFLFNHYSIKDNCNFCGKYKNRHGDASQTLNIKSDSTFVYEYRGIMASLLGGESKGKWHTKGDSIILNSEYSNKNYKIIEHRINHCDTKLDSFYMDICDSLIRINVKNINNEDIWHLRNVMINSDTSQINWLVLEYLEKDSFYYSGAFFKGDYIDSISIFGNWFLDFEDKVLDSKANNIIIKGNFADRRGYKYFVNESWIINKGKFIGNQNYGDFKKYK